MNVGSANRRAGGPRPARGRADERAGLASEIFHLFVLGSFAIAQPVLDLLARQAEFLVASDARPGEIVLLVIVLLVAVPVVIAGIEIVLHAVHRGLRAAVHLGAVFALGFLTLLPPVQQAVRLPALATVLAAATAAAFAAAYRRSGGLRWMITILGLAVVVFPVAFFSRSSIRDLVRPDVAPAPAAAEVRGRAVPIVMVIFDELNTLALMNEKHEIDAVRYPAFAGLAARSHWFRNATTVADGTERAIPAILTGLRPASQPRKLPIADHFPNNLFTLLAADYDLEVAEPVTRLCRDCAPSRPSDEKARMMPLLADVAVLYAHRVLPAAWASGLPEIDQKWKHFRDAAAPGRFSLGEMLITASPRRFRDVRRLLEAIDSSSRAPFYFLHTLLPHVPFECLPSGKVYGTMPLPEGLKDGIWADEETWSTSGFQRFLLQVGCTDAMLGKLIARLEDAGLYDRSLLVVTSDHGSSFRPGVLHKWLTEENFADVMPVPLFIKLPGQRHALISDRNVESIDILPSMAAALGRELPFAVDGCSVFSVDCPPRRSKRIFRGFEQKDFVIDAELVVKYDALARQLAIFGSGSSRPGGLHAFGPYAGLVGKSVAELVRGKASQVTATIDQRPLFEHVDPDAEFAPCYLSGVVDDGVAGVRWLALAVNGRVAALTRAAALEGAGKRFVGMIPESALEAGFNKVEVFLIEREDRGEPILVPTRSAPEISYSISRMFPVGRPAIVSSSGDRFPIGERCVEGTIDRLTVQRHAIDFLGWAFDRERSRAPQRVLLFYDRRFLYAADIAALRRDVAKVHGAGAERSGFSFTLPRELFPEPERGKFSFFALSGTEACELPVPARALGGL